MDLPADQKKVEALLEKNKGRSLLFSEGTYQIEMVDSEEKETFWPFIQMDDTGKLIDRFCTCARAETKKSCPHLSAAYSKIFNDQPEPLHVRFRESLWNALCQMASRRHGYETDILEGDLEKGFQTTSQTGKPLFSMVPLTLKGKKKLTEMIVNRPIETEETSLKFSNLSQEELLLWREGRPSHQLCYELSFWSDLAKWWMLLQEEGAPYHISFEDGSEELPRWIHIDFKDLKVGFYIAVANWPQIIPSLANVDSPLPLHEFSQQEIKKITYNEEKKSLVIDATFSPIKQAFPAAEETHIEVGDCIYIPKKGFYPAHVDPVLQEKEVSEPRMGSFLQKHAKLVQKYLQGARLSRDSIQPKYKLSVEPKGDLIIETYLFDPGDLTAPLSSYFPPWVYIHKKGFYLLENPLFQNMKKVIPKDQVSDFINRHRHWLNQYEGFQPHLSSLESYLTYQVTPQGDVRFDAQLEMTEERGELVDVGDWIYVRGKGFYAKTSARTMPLIQPGLVIPKEDVNSFIYSQKEDLEHIYGFFASFSPLEKTGLKVYLNEEKSIVVEPEYYFKSEELKKMAIFYGDYFYIPNQGFSSIPVSMRLPPDYRETQVIETSAEPYFIGYELELIRPSITFLDPALVKPSYCHLKVDRMKKDTKSQTGGWLLSLHYETDLGTIAPFEIWEAKQKNEWGLYSSGGLLLLDQPQFAWLKGISKKRWSKGGSQIRLTTMEWLRLNVLETIVPPEDRESLSLWEELSTFQPAHLPDLSGLKSELRTYQQQGVKWLWFLYLHGLSGLLCDEMGLGKTHQAMGLIAAATNQSAIKVLVVCPTSVIYHWEDLLKRFCPKMRVSVFYGSSRTLETEYDVLLTSYGILRSEKKALSQISFAIAIYDEVQIAKNPYSQTHKVLRSIDAKMRLGLTGTPIENRLLELKALFDLILPGYFPSEALFKSLFVNPIEKFHDAEKQQLLTRFIRPFILRRKKSEVLLELPEKIEEIAYCSLSEEQKTLYQKTLSSTRDHLLADLQDASKPVPYLHVFALLSTLKQICNHPTLINKDFGHYKKYASGKWDLFIELLAEARESGQKIVVFSQYLHMLDLIEAYLKEEKIGFAGIRGSTTDRKQQVDRFSTDPECEVFVASLQAAGVGIDLIAASIVIHYDRWWNPAKENQATDRVHRMGQRRGVQVFKLVTKNTIEEHIHHLIEKKSALAGLVAYDDKDQIKILDREELIQLLTALREE